MLDGWKELENCSHDGAIIRRPIRPVTVSVIVMVCVCLCVCMCVRVCHLSLSAVPALWFHVGEAEVCQAVVAAAVHRSIQTLESFER